MGLAVWDFPQLSQSFVYELALGLAARGAAVEVLPLNGAGPDSVAALGRLSPAAALVRDPPPIDRIGAVLRAARRPWEVRVDLAAPRRWAGTVRTARHLETAGAYDVIHAQFGTIGLELLRQIEIGSLQARTFVVHLRGYDITRFVRDEGPHVYDRLFRRADLVVANCAHFHRIAVSLGCPPDRIVTIGSPCDTDTFVPPARPRDFGADGRLRLVAVGRLVEKKGFADAIEAMALLPGLGVDAELDILGEGRERADLQARIDRLGLGDRVRLRGQAGREEVLAALHRADLGLAPSVTASDGDEDAAVNTLKEQMATGLPVIATRHGGIPELVVDGETGRLVPERDPAAIARAIADLAGRRQEFPALGARGRRKVVDEYGRDHIIDRTLAAYRRALGGNGEG